MRRRLDLIAVMVVAGASVAFSLVPQPSHGGTSITNTPWQAALETAATRTRPLATGSPLAAEFTSCWQHRHDDSARETAVAADIRSTIADWSCTNQRMRMIATFATFAPSVWERDVLGLALDTDGDLRNHCEGIEFVLLGYPDGSADLVRLGRDCRAPATIIGPATTVAESTTTVFSGFTIPWGAIGDPRAVRYQFVVLRGRDGLVLDSAPDSGLALVSGFKSSTLGDATVFVQGPQHRIDLYWDAVTSGDFNADEKDDVLFVAYGEGTDQVLLGTSTWLTPGPAVSIRGTHDCLISGDIDRDHDDDIILIGWGTRPDRILVASRGRFGPGPELSVPGTYDHCVAGNFTGGPRVDVLLIGNGTRADLLLMGTTSGFVPGAALNLADVYDDADSADFNGDSMDDILLTSWTGTDRYLIGTEIGLARRTFSESGLYDAALAGDFDADGYADMLYFGEGSQPDLARRGTRAGPIAPAPEVAITMVAELVVGDYDGNGTDDLVLCRQGLPVDPMLRGVR